MSSERVAPAHAPPGTTLPAVGALVPQTASAARPAPAPLHDPSEAVARQIASYLKSVGRALEFSVDETTGRTIVTVRDAGTGETIRQIPGEDALRLARALGFQTDPLIDVSI